MAGRFFLHRCNHWGYPECRAAFGWGFEQWIYFGGRYPETRALLVGGQRIPLEAFFNRDAESWLV